jgi:glycerophosphoryl diester phosphodiesterase
MRFSLFITFLFLLGSCHKKDKYNDIRIIGHAGSGLATPTSVYNADSQEAVEHAIGMQGIDGVEIDIQCSASGTAWLFHDASLDANTNGSGCINSLTDDYLQTLHFKTLEKEKLVQLKDLDFPFGERLLFLDVRSLNECTGHPIDQQMMINAIETALPDGILVTVITNNPDWVHDFYLKGWKVYFDVRDVSGYLNGGVMDETAGLCIRNAEISKNQVEDMHSSGKEVIIFEARSPKGIRSALKKFPDYLLADDLKATLIEKY